MNVTNILDYFYPQSPTINRIIGSIYFTTCIFIITLTILMLLFYNKYPEKQKNLPYKCMWHVESLSLVQQIIHLLSSFFSIFIFRTSRIIEQFLGALLISSYLTCVTFMLILTLNRFDVFYNQICFPRISRKKIYIVCVIICYTEQIIFFTFYIMPNNSLYYSLLDDAWHFNKQTSEWEIAYRVEYFIVTIQLCTAFSLYVLIIIRLFYLRSKKSLNSNSNIQKGDLKLLIPPVINFFICLFLEFSWYSMHLFVNPSRYTSAMQNFIWIIYSSNNTLVSLIMRKDFRKNIRQVFCMKNDNINKIVIKVDPAIRPTRS